jgi:Tfp pilus assembly protein PilP
MAVMTRTTLKALWFGGGGILATWVAVSPNHGVPTSSQPTSVAQSVVSAEPDADQLNAQADRLRERAAAGVLRSTTRNPFQFTRRSNGSARASHADLQPMPAASNLPAAPLPELRLSGVAEKAGKRTAIISSGSQIYLAGEGDSVAGGYTVVTIDPTTVLVRAADGAERRLTLPQ